MSKQQCKNGEHCPKFVNEDVCEARMKALDTKLKYLFGSSLLTVALIIVNLALALGGH